MPPDVIDAIHRRPIGRVIINGHGAGHIGSKLHVDGGKARPFLARDKDGLCELQSVAGDRRRGCIGGRILVPIEEEGGLVAEVP